MASKRMADDWIIKMETMLENQATPNRASLTINALHKAIDRYDRIQSSDHATRARARKIILAVSKKVIERGQFVHGNSLASREGTKTRLRKISSYANQLSKLLEPVLLHIDELDYTRVIVREFMPSVEEAARFATKLDPETAAQMLRILDSADTLGGLSFNSGLREVFEEIIQIHITPKKLDASKLLLDLAEKRLHDGEYITSYLLSREAMRSMLEDLTGVYTKDLDSENSPSPEWRFEDYLGYLIEVGLVPAEQGTEFLEIFVGEAEHLNNRWKKRREAERALIEVKNFLEVIYSGDVVNKEWL
jgi:hypothetical protein